MSSQLAFPSRLSLPSFAAHLPLAPMAAAAAGLLLAASLAWSVQLLREPLPLSPAAPPAAPPLDVKDGATLFGSQPDAGKRDALALIGILSLDPHHAAAIVSVGSDPARVVGLRGKLGDGSVLAAVRAHSIVVERNGLRREITLTAPQNPLGFVR